MGEYKISYIEQPSEDMTNSSRHMDTGVGIKEAFWDDNLSLHSCIAMLLGKDIKEITKKNPHILLYGKYLGGFAFEAYEMLPPLCILNVVFEDIPHNAVYYNNTVYDPKLGVFTVNEYKSKSIQVLSYIQVFIEEAYEKINWSPFVPVEIQAELDQDEKLKEIFNSLSAMQQSKLLNYIYPFSKASSLKESRSRSQKLKPKQVESIINHLKVMHYPSSENEKSVWEELYDFETIEAVETLRKCGVTTGKNVLDMGCGYGHYTIAASIASGERGRVIAVDKDKKALKHAKDRITELKLSNVACLNTDEKGLSEYYGNIDFIILYDVLHGIYNRVSWGEERSEFLPILRSLVKTGGILSIALYNEIERIENPTKKRTAKGSISTISITHEEAIKPYIELIESYGFVLKNVVENGGVHFDDFHSPYHWRKYGEVRVSKLERRNIYSFIKVD